MKAFTKLDAKLAPLPLANIDTDQIIPKQFLKTVEREGLARGLFYDFRFDAEGKEKSDFVLNRPEYKSAGVLVTGDNFGCGSSREHAPWALMDFGISCVIATSFADIFFNNCFQNGALPIRIDAARAAELRGLLHASPGAKIKIDLAAQMVIGPDGKIDRFEIDSFRKDCLLKGADEVTLTLGYDKDIKAFEAKQRQEMSWL